MRRHVPITVNLEYFVCMLFSYISYAAASVRKKNAYEKKRYKASQRIRSGQRLYENFMRTKGWRAQDTKIECVRNILDLQYCNFTNFRCVKISVTSDHGAFRKV